MRSDRTRGWPDGDDLIERALAWDKSKPNKISKSKSRFLAHVKREKEAGRDFDPSPRWNKMRGWHFRMKQRLEAHSVSRRVFVQNGRTIEVPLDKTHLYLLTGTSQ